MTSFYVTLESAAAQATGWALVHFLWQGTLVALIAACALRLMNRQSANARYLVACVSLLVLVAFPLATAWRSYEEVPATTLQPILDNASGRETAVDPSLSSPTTLSVTPAPLPMLERIHTALRPHLPWFVGVWFGGVALLSIRLLASWFAAQRLCQTASEASSRWQRTLGSLSTRMSLGMRVRLLESARVDVPMVIGWLRPVVLVPITAMTGLTPVQLQTILAHELAHIRRHDYLVNVLQSVVEILFFYHPAVWWLSNRIRLERENCCDDVAVSVCGNPLLYARALTELEELRSSASPAVAVNGGSLRERVTRLVSYPRLQCSYRWVTGVSILSLIAVLAVAAPLTLLAQQSKKQSEAEKARTESSVTIAEDEPADEDIDVYADEAVDEAGSYEVTPGSDGDEGDSEQVSIVSDDDDATAVVAIAPVPPAAAVKAPRPPRPPRAGVAPTPGVRITVAPPPTPHAPGVAPVAPIAPRTPGAPRLAPGAPVRVSQASQSAKSSQNEGKQNRWDGQLTVDQLIELRTAGVDAAYINELRKLGYGNLSFDDLINLRLHGVGPEYISAMNAYGFGHMSAEQLVELRNQGVTPGYIDEMKKLGYGNVSVDDFISLRIQGVTPEYVKQMNSAGFGRLSPEKLVEMRIHGVDPVYIGQLAAAGYPKLSLDDLVELRIHGVTPAFIKTLKDAGLDKLDVDEIIRLRNSGVDAEFIREMSRYKTQ